jgi:hypothetical protein
VLTGKGKQTVTGRWLFGPPSAGADRQGLSRNRWQTRPLSGTTAGCCRTGAVPGGRLCLPSGADSVHAVDACRNCFWGGVEGADSPPAGSGRLGAHAGVGCRPDAAVPWERPIGGRGAQAEAAPAAASLRIAPGRDPREPPGPDRLRTPGYGSGRGAVRRPRKRDREGTADKGNRPPPAPGSRPGGPPKSFPSPLAERQGPDAGKPHLHPDAHQQAGQGGTEEDRGGYLRRGIVPCIAPLFHPDDRCPDEGPEGAGE